MTTAASAVPGDFSHLQALKESLIALSYKLQKLSISAQPEKNTLKSTQVMARTIATVIRGFRDIAALKGMAMKKGEVKKNDHLNPAKTLGFTSEVIEKTSTPVKKFTRGERRNAEREAKKAERRLKTDRPEHFS